MAKLKQLGDFMGKNYRDAELTVLYSRLSGGGTRIDLQSFSKVFQTQNPNNKVLLRHLEKNLLRQYQTIERAWREMDVSHRLNLTRQELQSFLQFKLNFKSEEAQQMINLLDDNNDNTVDSPISTLAVLETRFFVCCPSTVHK